MISERYFFFTYAVDPWRDLRKFSFFSLSRRISEQVFEQVDGFRACRFDGLRACRWAPSKFSSKSMGFEQVDGFRASRWAPSKSMGSEQVDGFRASRWVPSKSSSKSSKSMGSEQVEFDVCLISSQ
jgi:hypothetical protein